MKKAPFIVCAVSVALVLGVGLWTLGCKSPSPTASQSELAQMKTETAFQFPVAEATLQTIRKTQNAQGLNDHDWMLFHYLVGDGGDPKWEDWCAISDRTPGNMRAGTVSLICPPSPAPMGALSSTKALLDQALQKKVRHLILGLSTPRQEEVINQGKLLTADTNVLLGAEVLFNPDLATKVKACAAPTALPIKYGFTRSQIQSKLLAKFPDSGQSGCQLDTVSQDVLANDSIAIKTIWVAAGWAAGYDGAPPGKENDHLSQTISIWHSSADNPGSVGANLIQIDLSDKDCDMPAPTAYTPTPIVPIGCFYSIPTTQDAIHAAQAQQKIGTGAQGTDVFLVLLGFHVATREMKNWTWQTFWWSGDKPDPGRGKTAPNSGPYAVADQHWGRYAMRTTLGGPDPYLTPPADMPQDSVASPYLEGPFSDFGTRSDCLNCHRYAVFNRKAPTSQAFQSVQTCGFNPGDQNCSVLKSPAKRADYFSAGKSTEFLWSLADSNVQGLHANGEKKFLDKLDSFMAQLNLKAEAVKAKAAKAAGRP